MKKFMEIMAEELSSAFEKAGYAPEYGRVTVSNRPGISASSSATGPWRERKHIKKPRS